MDCDTKREELKIIKFLKENIGKYLCDTKIIKKF